MLQRVIQAISKALHDQPHHFVMSEEVPITHDVEWKEAIGEIAVDAADALGIEEIGWYCPIREYVHASPDCEECFPVYRIRSIEDV